MTHAIGTSYDFMPFNRARAPRQIVVQSVSGALACAFAGVVGIILFYTPHATGPHVTRVPVNAPRTAPPAATPVTPSNTFKATRLPRRQARAVHSASHVYLALLDPAYSLGAEPMPLAQSAPLGANFHAFGPKPSTPAAKPHRVAPKPASADVTSNTPKPHRAALNPAPADVASNAPEPPLRPAGLTPPARHIPVRAAAREPAHDQRAVVAAAKPKKPSFFQKMFGTRQAQGPVLAYASPQQSGLGEDQGRDADPAALYGPGTAVYDISAHTVFMPNGTRLEAHSGRGYGYDNPHYVDQRMRGATPPNLYKLRPRRALFHGVHALRLIPIGDGRMYGRAGFLAHTYMLGPKGASFGCVSFKHYYRFLQAYRQGEVKRLVVVPRLDVVARLD